MVFIIFRNVICYLYVNLLIVKWFCFCKCLVLLWIVFKEVNSEFLGILFGFGGKYGNVNGVEVGEDVVDGV